MTIGQIYYLATICGNLYWFLKFLKGITTITLVLSGCAYLDSKSGFAPAEALQTSKMFVKWSTILLIFSMIASLLIPNKNDFLIITMTKDYTPEQVYTMTKDELKNSIDYFVNQIKEIKK